MSLWEKLKNQVQLWQKKAIDEQAVIVTARQHDQHYWDKKDVQKYPLCPNCWKTLILKFVIDGQNYYRCNSCGRED